jgi:metallophosphoesterase (TIGR00282 family)
MPKGRLMPDKNKNLRFLVFGDVVGRPGREAMKLVLPQLREEYNPDSVIANIENIAHGSGFSPETWKEARGWEADVYTTGDHAWDNEASISLLENRSLPIIRPANYPDGVPGRGYHVFSVGAREIAVINLQGQVFFRNHPRSPFHVLDELLALPEIKRADIVLVDFHAEATSESRGLGWHCDGRVAAVWGSHTHVPTADAQIMPKGCGYITDVGMVGSYNSIIGVDVAGPMRTFLLQLKTKYTYEDSGPYEIGAVVLDVDPKSKKTTSIAHIRKILNDTI